jgi:DNA repair protein RecO (recombination protein O)
MNEQTITAWTLSCRPYRDNDIILTLYSREWGKIKAVAPGVRKMPAKLRACAAPCVLSEFHLRGKPADHVYRIIGGKLISQLMGLFKDIDLVTEASWVCETLDRMTAWHQPSESKFGLLGKTLERIAGGTDLAQARIVFGFELIAHSGHGLELRYCVECGKPIVSAASVAMCSSGVICRDCRHKQDCRDIDCAAYEYLQTTADGNNRLADNPANKLVFSQLSAFLDFVLRHYLDWPLKSAQFREKMAAYGK